MRAEVKRRGLWAPFLGKEHGGMGLGLADFARVAEALGFSPWAHYAFNCQAPDVGNMELLAKFGTDEQKERWLAPVAAGTFRSCFAMTEPERAGSNPTWLETRAVRDGDDWVIDDHKWFTSGADGARIAVVMAVTDPDAAPHKRASMILVPTETPGWVLERNIPVMGEAGSGWASHGEVRLTRCRVPASNLLGPRGAGFALAQERLGPGRIHHCMRWIGVCERALDLLCRHAATRELAPGVALGGKQTIQAWIAESRARIDAARLLVLHVAWTIDHVGQEKAREGVSLIKFHVAEVMQEVLDRALQVHGGLGMTDDTPLAWMWRHERAARIYDGADEVHKTVVARRILKGYGVEVK